MLIRAGSDVEVYRSPVHFGDCIEFSIVKQVYSVHWHDTYYTILSIRTRSFLFCLNHDFFWFCSITQYLVFYRKISTDTLSTYNIKCIYSAYHIAGCQRKKLCYRIFRQCKHMIIAVLSINSGYITKVYNLALINVVYIIFFRRAYDTAL